MAGTACEPGAGTSEDLALDGQLCFAVYAAGHALNRAYRGLLEPYGLTYSQYLVLLVLWETDGVAVKEIGGRLLLDSGTLTPLLKRLEAAGYVSRRRDEKDERQVRISLTPKGLNLESEIGVVRTALACRMGLDPETLGRLKDELTALRMRIDAGLAAS